MHKNKQAVQMLQNTVNSCSLHRLL